MEDKKVVIKLTLEIKAKDYIKGFACDLFDNLNEIGNVTLNDIKLVTNETDKK